jgi:hypothetical protein
LTQVCPHFRLYNKTWLATKRTQKGWSGQLALRITQYSLLIYSIRACMTRPQYHSRLTFVKPLLVNKLPNTIAKHNPCPPRPLSSLTHKQAHLPKRQLPPNPYTHPGKLTAIATQHKLTYGLNLSPTRAALQNVPSGLYGLVRFRVPLSLSFMM